MRQHRFPISIRSGSTRVKIYRVRHRSTASGFVYCVSYNIGGRRFLPQFTDLDKALDEARLRADQLAAGKIESAAFSRPEVDELRAARSLVGETPVLSALKEWARAHDLTGGHVLAAAELWKARNVAKITRKTVAEVVKEFKSAKTKAGFNVADDHATCFTAIETDLGANFIDAVTAGQLSAWLGKRENPVTRNTYRKRIVSVWRWAQRNGYLPRELKTEAEQTDRARESAPDIGIITATTFENLLIHFRTNEAELLPVLVLAGFTGLRRAELHGQKWEDIDLQKGFVRVTVAKRGTPARRLVPLSPAAIKWLLLSGNRLGLIGTGMSVDRMRLAARAAKFSLPENCFRHGYISHRVAATGNVPEVALESGNSPTIVHRHYRELVTKAEGEAWFSISIKKRGKVIKFGTGK